MIGNKEDINSNAGLNNSEKRLLINLTQVGVSDPVMTVLNNDFDIEPEIKRNAPAKFAVYMPFKFLPNRTAILMNKPNKNTIIYRKNTSEIVVETSVEGVLNETTIEIVVKPLVSIFSNTFSQIFN